MEASEQLSHPRHTCMTAVAAGLTVGAAVVVVFLCLLQQLLPLLLLLLPMGHKLLSRVKYAGVYSVSKSTVGAAAQNRGKLVRQYKGSRSVLVSSSSSFM